MARMLDVKHGLVGGKPTPLKNDGVSNSWEYSSQYMEYPLVNSPKKRWKITMFSG